MYTTIESSSNSCKKLIHVESTIYYFIICMLRYKIKQHHYYCNFPCLYRLFCPSKIIVRNQKPMVCTSYGIHRLGDNVKKMYVDPFYYAILYLLLVCAIHCPNIKWNETNSILIQNEYYNRNIYYAGGQRRRRNNNSLYNGKKSPFVLLFQILSFQFMIYYDIYVILWYILCYKWKYASNEVCIEEKNKNGIRVPKWCANRWDKFPKSSTFDKSIF